MPIEQRGVDTIPDGERTSGPRDLVSILLGSNLALGVVIFGWLPVSFGLGFWGSASSLAAGTLVGAVLTAPLALVSLRSATNLSTSSGAHFGVRGRLLGSVIGLLLSLGYTALTLWVGGDVVVGTLHRLIGLPTGGVSYAVVYAVLAGGTAVGAVYGYRVLLRLSKVLAIGLTVLLAVGVIAYAPTFGAAPVPGTAYALGGFWQTWLLSTVVAGLSGPIAFITLLGDYSRYVSPRRHTSQKVFAATYLGLVVGLLVPQLFGTFSALAVGAGEDYASPLVAGAPFWYLGLLLLNASSGSVGNAGLMLYSMGLDLDAIVPRATRTQATYVVAAISTALVYGGHFLWEAQDAMTSFVLLMTALCTPWAVIVVMGFIRCRGDYDADALQVYNRGTRGGRYWYRAGWNVRATIAWVLGSAVGLMDVDTPLYQGPLLPYTGGIDVSFLLAAAVGGSVYALLTLGRPRPTPALRTVTSGTATTVPDAPVEVGR
ncbi:putative NCS1 family transporter [Streptomyces sp. NBRC 110611]|uniref:cytosine permease n=1 Tax=Streptomyces sp. NBRC 110611 TaxID=1621259 RepID=UPI00083749F2|nr:cytosine permease [Streptomyces sp. NBRC 110611]GAU69139.1 putative NCS1 family transporter [Streptomyces sp. NBRC 110611]